MQGAREGGGRGGKGTHSHCSQVADFSATLLKSGRFFSLRAEGDFEWKVAEFL